MSLSGYKALASDPDGETVADVLVQHPKCEAGAP
jgi:hypothetical protein